MKKRNHTDQEEPSAANKKPRPPTMTPRVETMPRLAQWRIDGLPPGTSLKSAPFKIGLWNWFVLYFNHFRFFLMFRN